MLPAVFGVEDCLTLNVYAPIIGDDVSNPLPVMVFLHGGYFSTGSASPRVFGPEYIMDKDVVQTTTTVLDALASRYHCRLIDAAWNIEL